MPIENEPKRKKGEALESREHSLPGVPEVQSASTRVIRHVVKITFLVLMTGLAGVLIVASTVRIDMAVEASGTLRPVGMWLVRSPESGSIAEVAVSSGDTVRQGQVLMRLDSLRLKSDLERLQSQHEALSIDLQKSQSSRRLQRREREQQRERTESGLMQVRANLRKELIVFGFKPEENSFVTDYELGSKARLDRAGSARATLRSSKIEMDRTQISAFDLKGKRTEVRHLTSQIRSTRKRLDRLTITSPATGVVLTDQVDQMAGHFVQRGELLLKVAESDRWQADLYIGENSIDELEVGDLAKIEAQTFRPEERSLIRGRVSAITSEPVRTGKSSASEVPATALGQYRVTIEVSEEASRQANRDRMRQEYSVRGEIITQRVRIITRLWEYLGKRTG